jgi:hypothetical protein
LKTLAPIQLFPGNKKRWWVSRHAVRTLSFLGQRAVKQKKTVMEIMRQLRETGQLEQACMLACASEIEVDKVTPELPKILGGPVIFGGGLRLHGDGRLEIWHDHAWRATQGIDLAQPGLRWAADAVATLTTRGAVQGERKNA